MPKKPEPPPVTIKPMAVRISNELRQRLRVFVAQRDRKIQEVLAEAIDEYLKKRGA